MRLMQMGAVALAVVGALVAGYWLGSRQADTPAAAPGAPAAVAPAAGTAQGGRKLLYYRNPMGLPDTSPTPKKDPMGMDYIPVYEGEDAGAAGEVKIGTDKVQKLGVRTEIAAMRELARSVGAAGRVEIDERRIHTVAPKFEGWVERLHVNATGQPVKRGQPLFEVYSPELVSAQREYVVAARGVATLKDAPAEAQAAMRQLADAALARLRNWDVSGDQIKALAAGGEPRRTLTYRSPAGGVVLEKKAVAGMRFSPGEALYQIADIGAVWVLADVAERDIGGVKAGQKANIDISAYPERRFEGRVAYVYPTLNPETRTVPVRIELANPGGLLKPAMYARVELDVGARAKALAVPASAVIDSGTRQVVLVQKAAGTFEPRSVKLGARGDEYVEVREGVSEGEAVVVAANFLIDAESNLKAALGGFGAAPGGGAPAAKPSGHRAEGTLDAVDAAAGTVTISHGPVASLGWPAMTMDFALANPAVLGALKPGSAVRLEFVERQRGEWVITQISPQPAPGHAGH